MFTVFQIQYNKSENRNNSSEKPRTHKGFLNYAPIWLTHLKLVDEVREDAKEGLCVGDFAVLSKEGCGLGKLLHGSLLE